MKKLFVVPLVLLAVNVFAQQNVSAPQKFALVIGNSDYKNITKLNNPINDADDMTAVLEKLGFKVDKITNGSQEQMENAIQRLKENLNIQKNSYGFLFYAGHGVQSNGFNYLIPVDAEIISENYLKSKAVSVQIMLEELNEAGNILNVVVLDACRDNPFSWNRSGARGLAMVTPLARSIIVYATSAGAIASDGIGRNGLFTDYLLKNLKTPGLEVSEIFKRTGADVSQASNERQIPAIYIQFFGNAYLDSQSAPQPASPYVSTAEPAPQWTAARPAAGPNETLIVAQQPLIVKAPLMVLRDPLTPDEAASVGGVCDKLLSEAKNLRIINKLVLDKGMRDYKFQQNDWNNVEKIIALGEVLNIGWVVRPQLQKRPNSKNHNYTEIIITAALLNIQTKEIICTAPVILNNVNEAQNKITALINEITQIISGGTGGIAQSAQSSAAYRVGDRGPAGGWVFYDKGSYSDGWRYLEVAPRETETALTKSKYVEKVPGTERGIGTGKNNTALILQSKQDYQIIKAAKICANMELYWFRDWFLPSFSELSRLFTIPTPKFGGPNLGGFSVGYYWSSSASGDIVSFSEIGEMSPDRSKPEYFIRAVRAF